MPRATTTWPASASAPRSAAALLPAGVQAGDALIGLPGSGVHSNGFSLVRRILEMSGARLDAPAPFMPGQALGEALMTPTRIYVAPLLALHRAGLLRAAAHITGGGLPGNVPRMLPDGLHADLDAGAWPLPPVFPWLARTGGVADAEMLQVFNCGLGMVLAVSDRDAALALLASLGEPAYVVGQVVSGDGPAEARVAVPDGWLT